MVVRKEKEIKVIYAVTILLFAAFLAVPIIRLLGESFVLDTGWGMENYTSVLTGKGFAEAFGNSIDFPDQCGHFHSTGVFPGVQHPIYELRREI